MVFITFIMSIYNTREEWIERAVNSIIRQTDKDWELIVVDDGSKQQVAEYCDKLATLDDRIKVKHQSNQGLSVARNYGMDNSNGKWIAFIDADDWIVEDYITQLKKVLVSNDFEVLSYGHTDICNEKLIEHLWGSENIHFFNSTEKKGVQMALLQLPKGLKEYPMFFGAQWKMVYSLEFLNKYDIRNTPGLYKAQDSVFNLYVIENVQRIGYYNKSLYYYYINSESVTGAFNSNLERYKRLLDAYKTFIDRYNKDDDYKMAYEYNALIQFDGMLEKYFFHSNNTDSSKIRRNKMNNLLCSEPYKSILTSINMNNKTTYKKLMIRAMKNQSYIAIKILYNVRKLVRH